VAARRLPPHQRGRWRPARPHVPGLGPQAPRRSKCEANRRPIALASIFANRRAIGDQSRPRSRTSSFFYWKSSPEPQSGPRLWANPVDFRSRAGRRATVLPLGRAHAARQRRRGAGLGRITASLLPRIRFTPDPRTYSRGASVIFRSDNATEPQARRTRYASIIFRSESATERQARRPPPPAPRARADAGRRGGAPAGEKIRQAGPLAPPYSPHIHMCPTKDKHTGAAVRKTPRAVAEAGPAPALYSSKCAVL
jgi:hypothetical protein